MERVSPLRAVVLTSEKWYCHQKNTLVNSSTVGFFFNTRVCQDPKVQAQVCSVHEEIVRFQDSTVAR